MIEGSFIETSGYQIRLSNNLVWSLSSDCKELQLWLNKVASIMELDKGCAEYSMPVICSGHKETHEQVDQRERNEAIDESWECYEANTLRILHEEKSHNLRFSIKPFASRIAEIIAMKSALYPLYRDIISMGGQLFHAGLIELNGRGVILAGRSGAGKSTCCRRLPDYWNAHCDDELLLILDGNGEYRAHPLPTWSEYLEGFSEKTWNIQNSVPVCGVFFIEQAMDDAALSLFDGESASLINESSRQGYMNYGNLFCDQGRKVLQGKLFNNSCAIAKKIPAFTLQVSLEGKFWEEIERVLGLQDSI